MAPGKEDEMKKKITPILLLLAIPMMSACVPYAVKAQPAATQDSSSIVNSVVATMEAESGRW